jgi:hypothetical protein
LAGCGAFQRSSPTGGWANGIPLNMRTAGVLSAAAWTTPFSVLTWSAANAPAASRGQSTSERAVARFIEARAIR